MLAYIRVYDWSVLALYLFWRAKYCWANMADRIVRATTIINIMAKGAVSGGDGANNVSALYADFSIVMSWGDG